MAYLSLNYNDQILFTEIKKLRPEINFGNHAQLEDFEIIPGTANTRNTIELKVAIPLSKEELFQVLDASRE